MIGNLPQPALIASAPIEGNIGQPPRAGTVVFVRPIDNTLLGEIGASTNHSVAVLDPRGAVVARGPGFPAGIPWGRIAAAGSRIRVQGAWGFGSRPLAAAAGGRGATLVVVESRAVTLRAEGEMRCHTLLALGVLLGLATLGGTALSFWLLRGFSRLKRSHGSLDDRGRRGPHARSAVGRVWGGAAELSGSYSRPRNGDARSRRTGDACRLDGRLGAGVGPHTPARSNAGRLHRQHLARVAFTANGHARLCRRAAGPLGRAR